MKLLGLIVLYANDEEKSKFNKNIERLSQWIDVKFIRTEREYEDFAYIKNIKDSIKICDTRYCWIVKSSYVLNERLFGRLFKTLESADGKSPLYFFTPFRKNDKGRKIPFFITNKKVLTGKDNFINIHLSSYIISRELLTEVEIPEFIDWDYFLIFNLIRKAKKYINLGIDIETTSYQEWDFYNYERVYYKEWYLSIEQEYLRLLQVNLGSKFVKIFVTYLIELRFAANRNNRNKNIVNEIERDRFARIVREIYQKIPNRVLIKHNLNGVRVFPKYMCWNNLRIKYAKPELVPNIVTNDSSLVAYYNDDIIEKGENLSAEVLAINFDSKQRVLRIDFELINAYCLDQNKANVYLEFGKVKIPAKRTKVYSRDRYFGVTNKEGLLFQITIPEGRYKNGMKKAMVLEYRSFRTKLPLFFIKTASRISNIPGSYWVFGKYILQYNEEEKQLQIRRKSTFKILLDEVKFLFKQISYKDQRSKVQVPFLGKVYILSQVFLLRMIYWATLPYFRNKNIWITFDQLFKGGDNGEYFFRYVRSLPQPDKCKVYYIINQDSDDCKRLEKDYGGVLHFRSLKAKILALHAKIVLATRVDVKQYLGFNNMLDPYIRGLLNYDVICLQHGLSIQEIAEYQNRLFDNTKLYLCASQYEIKNLLNPEYGYSEEDLKLVGLARYDGLIQPKTNKKIILIAPTWRRNVTAGTNRKGEQHQYSENFKHTNYFRIYNRLINDKKLISEAKEYGYELIYLIHPILTPQIDDFDKNDYVKIIGGASNDVNYEQMLTEASVMITDHSGIMYDFAYMRKPLIYYHPDDLPPQYMAKTMNYQVNGFGKVCSKHEDLVDEIIRIMQHDSIIEKEYAQRANDFFAFNDHENCKRIFDAVKKYQEM